MPMIDNPEIKDWYIAENARREARDAQTLLVLGLTLIQMVLYYNLWDDAVSNRDEIIDKQKVFLDYLLEKDLSVDFPMMETKQQILGLTVPASTVCSDATFSSACSASDGIAVDAKGHSQSRLASGGLPIGWAFHEGLLLGARASSYTGAIAGNASKRREENFREQKTKLVLRGQATARFSPRPILQDYSQAISIQEGLAQIFAAGFNSAGVGFGTALGQLSSSGASGSSTAGGV